MASSFRDTSFVVPRWSWVAHWPAAECTSHLLLGAVLATLFLRVAVPRRLIQGMKRFVSPWRALGGSAEGSPQDPCIMSILRNLLDAIGSRVAGPIPAELGNLPFLTDLILYNNKLDGEMYLR